MNRWLRKIILFPFSILMGNISGGEVTTVDAGAVSETPAAESGGVAEVTPEVNTDAGAVSETPAAESDGVTDQNLQSQEGVKKAPTEAHQRTLEERVQELAEKRFAEMEGRLTTRLQEVAQPEKLNFIPNLDMTEVNKYLQTTINQIEALQLEGKYLEAMDLQDELNQVRKEVKDNETRKAEYVKSKELQTQSEKQIEAINIQIQDASKLVAAEFKIPEDVWKKGEEFFIAERRAKPLIDAQYREKVMLQGPVAAMLWAKEYVEQNMGKKESELIQQKETAKESLPSGKTSGGMVVDAKAANLAALKTAAQSGNPSDLAAYSRALRESRTQ